MIVRAIKNNEDNSSREWVFCRGLTAYKTEQKAIEQDVKSALLEFKNDCFWALQSGIDWLTRLGSKNQKELLDNEIIDIIKNRYGVIKVENFESAIVERAYNSTCNIYTIFSEKSLLLEFTQNI